MSITSVGPKIVASIGKGVKNSKKIALPQEISLINVTKNGAKNGAKYSSCGAMDMLCGAFNRF